MQLPNAISLYDAVFRPEYETFVLHAEVALHRLVCAIVGTFHGGMAGYRKRMPGGLTSSMLRTPLDFLHTLLERLISVSS